MAGDGGADPPPPANDEIFKNAKLMPKTVLNAPQETAGSLLKKMLKKKGLTQRDAIIPGDDGAGGRKLWQILNGRQALDAGLAMKIAKKCGFDNEERNQLLKKVRSSQGAPAQPANEFGRYLAEMRLRPGKYKSTTVFANECHLNQPDICAMEAGRLVPSPATAATFAACLSLSSTETAKFFRLFGNAVRRRLDISKTSTIPELAAMLEWLLLIQTPRIDKKTGTVTTVALPFSEIPRAEQAVEKIQDALRNLSENFATQFQSQGEPNSQPIPYSVINHPDGRVSVILPMMVTY
jgi:hypothetical protein